MLFQGWSSAKGGWGGTLRLLADAFGMQLDEIREEHERLPAPDDRSGGRQ